MGAVDRKGQTSQRLEIIRKSYGSLIHRLRRLQSLINTGGLSLLLSAIPVAPASAKYRSARTIILFGQSCANRSQPFVLRLLRESARFPPAIGRASVRNRTGTLTSRQIDRIIKAARCKGARKRKPQALEPASCLAFHVARLKPCPSRTFLALCEVDYAPLRDAGYSRGRLSPRDYSYPPYSPVPA